MEMEREREREGQLMREVEVKIEKEAEIAEAAAEVEVEAEGGLVERWRVQHFSTITTSNGSGHGVFTEQSIGDKAILIERGEFSIGHSELKNGNEINQEAEDMCKTEGTYVDNPPPSENSPQNQNANDISIKIEESELYLEKLYKKPSKHEFYCPNCKVCIDKVLIRSEEEIKCPTCLEFLKPLGECIFGRRPDPTADPTTNPPLPPTPPPSPGAIKREFLKSIVFGGLIESITSLGVVTSAASADAATMSIIALALANLIGGLFVIGHNLKELRKDESRVTLKSNEAEEQVERYQEVLGQKSNFIVHASVAILSFLVFGLVPPVVYGFSFYDSDNRELKLAAVAAASLLCITLLAIVKTYIQKPTEWYNYITNILYYLAIGLGVSGISFLAGYLVKELIEKLGWFESSVAATLSLPEMSLVKTAWGSY